MKKSDERLMMKKLGYELARSGECKNWMEVELRLRSEGYLEGETRRWTSDTFVKQELDRICAQARAKVS